MSFADERKSIENRFNTEWTATPIAYDNVPFNPPSNADWVRLNIQNGDSGYRSLESSIRHTGIINVQIFTPINKATKTSRQYADIVSDIFSDQRFDDIVTNVSSINIIADDDAWLQTNVTTPYYRDAEKIIIPTFEPFYFVLKDTKLLINVDDPEIIMSGDVNIATPTRLEISGVISCTFNYVVGIAVYVDGVPIGMGTTRSNLCHVDCAFVLHHATIGSTNYMNQLTYDIVTDVLGAGTHKIEIGILGKYNNIKHTIYVGDVFGNFLPSSSTLLIKEFRAIIQGGGGYVPRNPSRWNSYLPVATSFTTPTLTDGVAEKLFITTTPRTIQDFTLDIPNHRYFLDDPTAVNRWFIIHACTTLQSSVPNHVVTLEMYINGVFEDGVSITRFMSAGEKGSVSFAGTASMSNGDYIEVYATAENGGTLTFERLAITINEIVGAI